MNDQQKIAQLFRILTDCSSSDAERASQSLCRKPEAIALLATACAVSVDTFAQAGTATKSLAVVQAWPAAIAAGALTGAALIGAKRFCMAVLDQTVDGIKEVDISLLRSYVPN